MYNILSDLNFKLEKIIRDREVRRDARRAARRDEEFRQLIYKINSVLEDYQIVKIVNSEYDNDSPLIISSTLADDFFALNKIGSRPHDVIAFFAIESDVDPETIYISSDHISSIYKPTEEKIYYDSLLMENLIKYARKKRVKQIKGNLLITGYNISYINYIRLQNFYLKHGFIINGYEAIKILFR